MWGKSQARWIALMSSMLFLGAIFWILHRQQSLEDLADIWRRSDKGAILLAIAAMTAANVTGAWRLTTIMTVTGVDRAGLLSMFRVQLVSQFAAHGAPISALGDLARAAMLKLRFGVTIGRAVRVVLYERVAGALGAAVIGLGAVAAEAWLPEPHRLIGSQLLLWSGGLAGTALLLLFNRLHVNTRLELFNQAVRAIALLSEMLAKPAIAARLLLISLLQMMSMALIFIVLAAGMHIALSPVQALLFMPLIFFVSSLPIFYLGWGAREAVVIAAFGGTAMVSTAEAVALSVGFGVIVFLSSLPGAVFWLLRPSMRKAITSAGLNLSQAEQT
jgi:glycosyltransferase 2 family protein